MKLRDDEVRRLIAYLRPLVSEDELKAIEDQLRSDVCSIHHVKLLSMLCPVKSSHRLPFSRRELR